MVGRQRRPRWGVAVAVLSVGAAAAVAALVVVVVVGSSR